MAALSGIAAATALLMTPVGLLEMVVASSGLSEALPAAAPPLGLTARLSLAGFAALLAVGLAGVMRRDSRHGDDGIEEERRAWRAQGARKMSFAFSKLTALARGRAMSMAEPEMPVLRRADAHPDAPPRLPIFASRDFGGAEIFARPESGRRSLVIHTGPEPEPILPPSGFARARAAAPSLEEREALPQPVFRPTEPFAEPIEVKEVPEPIMKVESRPLAPLPLPAHGLSIPQLTERLERGLASRRRIQPTYPAQVLADMPVAARVPVRDTVAPDADEALRAALGALRSIASIRPR
ncbi:hypothetical protein MOK15_15125 [Sphingobium sp. BYY-5]|uniref:hypothetical protein n=1 Tax=Sphingobium sp. BYY-5 TaxID=2926400 RepID=UPI001FA72481|nr:hypothetical protein [Sphingobium sp. BYY-5]MCI4591416.1 hypothetical protein [Sphingobium sp. BYY-5]